MHLFIGNLLFIHPLISFSTLHANQNLKSMDRGLIEKAASIVGNLGRVDKNTAYGHLEGDMMSSKLWRYVKR